MIRKSTVTYNTSNIDIYNKTMTGFQNFTVDITITASDAVIVTCLFAYSFNLSFGHLKII